MLLCKYLKKRAGFCSSKFLQLYQKLTLLLLLLLMLLEMFMMVLTLMRMKARNANGEKPLVFAGGHLAERISK